MRDISDLRQRQALPLRAKVLMSQNRIREWYDHWNGGVCISFSGGKDSTVLAHLVHDLYPEVPLVFANTGLEYPEIQAFARKMGAEIVRPKMQFSEVISKYGYPIISKENAEAIHYARKIRNGGGGTTERKRTELCGERTAGVTDPSSMRGGAKPISRQNRMETCDTYRQTSRGGGTIPQTVRMRIQFNGQYGGIRAGVDGNSGEEIASPG